MEDALEVNHILLHQRQQVVSILVLMEDALELFWTLLPFEVQLLPIGNPTPGGQSLL